MIPQPIKVRLASACHLELSASGDEIVARLWHQGKEVPPTVRAVANSECVRTHAGQLHIGRTAFAIPESERRAVADFLTAAQSAT